MSDRLRAVDGLRGLAILGVMAFHFSGVAPTPPLVSNFDRIFFALIRNGWAGVDLFFVLSGFLITKILLESKGNSQYFATFWIRRALRIVPLYFAFLAFVYLVLPARDQGPASPWWYFTFLSNFWINYRGSWSSYALDPTWSLAAEAQFYLLWPLVIAVVPRKGLPYLFTVAIGLAFVLRVLILALGLHPLHAYIFPFCRMDTFAAGAWIALVCGPLVNRARLSQRALILFCVSAPIAVIVFAITKGVASDPLETTYGFTLNWLLGGSLLLMALTAEKGKPFYALLTSWPLRVLGERSYCLYLIHSTVAHFLARQEFSSRLLFCSAGILVTFCLATIIDGIFELARRRGLWGPKFPYASGAAWSRVFPYRESTTPDRKG